jgi:hypothetical protein
MSDLFFGLEGGWLAVWPGRSSEAARGGGDGIGAGTVAVAGAGGRTAVGMLNFLGFCE